MTYEAWRITFQSSEQAARAAYEQASRLQQECDALAAHNQRLISGWFAVDDCEVDSDEMAVATAAMHLITQESPAAQSLDRLKAQWQAEARSRGAGVS